VIVRFLGILGLAWAFGFAVFMLLLPKPLDGFTSDAIVGQGGSTAVSRCSAITRRSGCS
jgi:hypothetical protein